MTNDHPEITQVTDHDSYIIVTFPDALDSIHFHTHGPFALRNELNEIAEQSDGRTIILDIESEWTLIRAEIYNDFAMLHEKPGDRLLFCNLSENADGYFRVNQLAEYLKIYPTRAAAIASVEAE